MGNRVHDVIELLAEVIYESKSQIPSRNVFARKRSDEAITEHIIVTFGDCVASLATTIRFIT
jgi:hypothetical protein